MHNGPLEQYRENLALDRIRLYRCNFPIINQLDHQPT